MFGFLKSDPTKALRKQYEGLMKEARDLQRGGDIRGFASKSAEAQMALAKLEQARAAADKAD